MKKPGKFLISLAAGSCLIVFWVSSIQAQELKKVKIGYPAFSLTFLTFFVAKDAVSSKSTDSMSS